MQLLEQNIATKERGAMVLDPRTFCFPLNGTSHYGDLYLWWQGKFEISTDGFLGRIFSDVSNKGMLKIQTSKTRGLWLTYVAFMAVIHQPLWPLFIKQKWVATNVGGPKCIYWYTGCWYFGRKHGFWTDAFLCVEMHGSAEYRPKENNRGFPRVDSSLDFFSSICTILKERCGFVNRSRS